MNLEFKKYLQGIKIKAITPNFEAKKTYSFNRKSIFARAKYLLSKGMTVQYKEVSKDSHILELELGNNAEWVTVDSWSMALKVAWYEAKSSVYSNRIKN